MPEIQTQEQLERLDQLLGERGIRLYFRPHPVQELSLFRQEPRENIFIADDEFLRKKGMDLYELLGAAKALITDYSSVYYDFLLTERPIGLTIGDREQYFSKYDCPFDSLAGNVEGVKIESFEEVLAFVRNVADGTIDCEPLRELKKRYHDFTDGSACERLYKHMQHTYGFDKQKIG
jgi:CDP-glycerol glycerophosphotransferase (TagB/SpsB family)